MSSAIAAYKKQISKTKKGKLAELNPDEITKELVESTDGLLILKQFAIKLGIPFLNTYNTNNKASLKLEILKALKARKEGQALPVPSIQRPVPSIQRPPPSLLPSVDEEVKIIPGPSQGEGSGETKEDSYLNRLEEGDKAAQYAAIKKYLKSFMSRNVSTVYGKIGEEFMKLWTPLSRAAKVQFIREFNELNVAPAEVNPLLFLIEFKRGNEASDDDSIGKLMTAYFKKLISGESGTPEMKEMEQNKLFPKNFVTAFEKLSQGQKLAFAGNYIRFPDPDPLSALKSFLHPMQNPIDRRNRVKGGLVKKIYVAGGKNEYLYPYDEKEDEQMKKNDYRKCVQRWRTTNIVIQPINLPIGEDLYSEVVPALTENGYFYYPTDKLFELMCRFHLSKTGSTVTIFCPEMYKFKIAIFQDNEFKELSPTELYNIDNNTIFAKYNPYWVLSTPLFEVDDIFLKIPELYLDKWLFNWDNSNKVDLIKDPTNPNVYKFKETVVANPVKLDFTNQILELRKSSRAENLVVYYTKFILAFAPFIPSLRNKVNLSIIEKLKKGYLNTEAFMAMPLDEKLPEFSDHIESLLISIRDYAKVISPIFIQAISLQNKLPQLPDIVFSQSAEVKTLWDKCPEFVEQYNIEDIIIYNNKAQKTYNCVSIPQLLKAIYEKEDPDMKLELGQKKKMQYVAKTFKYNDILLDRSFIEDFKKKYGHLKTEKFIDRKGNEIVVNQKLYDGAHAIVNKVKPQQKYSMNDIAAAFDNYFRWPVVYADPVSIIKNLLEFKLEEKCLECGGDNVAVHSLIDRSNGTTIAVGFCDYQCMEKHKFMPLSMPEEEIDYTPNINTVAQNV